MKAIYTDKFGDFGCSQNTASEYDNQITYETLAMRLAAIADAVERNSEYVCYVVGMGAHPKSTYKKTSEIKGIEVVWYSSVLPKQFRFLKCVVASYAGSVKVNDSKRIEEVFMKLVDNSMAGIYVFPISFELNFLENVCNNIPPSSFDYGVKCCKDYFMYVVDADNAESDTGIYELISYGVETMPDLFYTFRKN